MAKIVLETLHNTRDLGGIINKNGKAIRKGRLIRSGTINGINAADEKILRDHGMHTVVDLRWKGEAAERPDPKLEGVEYIALPVLEDPRAGISRDSESDKRLFEDPSARVLDEQHAVKAMSQLYRILISTPFVQKQYNRFFDILLDNKEGAVLYHCTAGKDRAGLASILILLALDVDRETILADYLETNRNIEPEILYTMEKSGMKDADEKTRKAFYTLLSAKEEYVQQFFDYMDQYPGGTEGYLENAIGLDPAKREKMRALYLEQ